jgi:RNA recognition motif-containing protein
MKILIRNLARTTTEVALRSMFEAHGTVQSCTLIMDKETDSSKGFAFIEMPKQGDAKAAMKNLNGKDVDGNKIRVKKAESKGDGKDDPDPIEKLDDSVKYRQGK